MSEKEKKQAIVLGALLAGFLGVVLIIDPFGFFGSGSDRPQRQQQEEPEAEQEETEDEDEEQEVQVSASSPLGSSDGLPIYHEISELERGFEDPAYTDQVWPPQVEGPPVNEDVQLFDVRGFDRVGGVNYVRIGTVRYTVNARITCNNGERWRIEDIERGPWRMQVEHDETRVQRGVDSRGYPIPDED